MITANGKSGTSPNVAKRHLAIGLREARKIRPNHRQPTFITANIATAESQKIVAFQQRLANSNGQDAFRPTGCNATSNQNPKSKRADSGPLEQRI
jgi:hypothetical protein